MAFLDAGPHGRTVKGWLLDTNVISELHDWLLHRVRPMFDQRVLEVYEDVVFKWHLLAVVTRDTRDVAIARVPLFSSWVDGTPRCGP